MGRVKPEIGVRHEIRSIGLPRTPRQASVGPIICLREPGAKLGHQAGSVILLRRFRRDWIGYYYATQAVRDRGQGCPLNEVGGSFNQVSGAEIAFHLQCPTAGSGLWAPRHATGRAEEGGTANRQGAPIQRCTARAAGRAAGGGAGGQVRSGEHTAELQSRPKLVCRLLL